MVEVQSDGSIRLIDMYLGQPFGDDSSERTCGYVID